MGFRVVWQKVLSAKWVLGVFLAVLAALWLLAEVYGVKPGVPTFVFLLLGAIIIGIAWILGRKLNNALYVIDGQAAEIDGLKKKLAVVSHPLSYCCVREQTVPVCPLGVTRIHDRAIDTLESSLHGVKHSYKWLGFSAFNVAHNNRHIFEAQKHVKFQFVTLHPDAKDLLAQVDRDFRTTLRASEQAARAHNILTEIAREIHPGVEVVHHWQLPSFRLILLDESRALVSFYEAGKDALRTPQIEITESEHAPYCLLNWFQMFYDKVIQTEVLLGRAGPNSVA